MVRFRAQQVDVREKLQLRMAPMIDVVFLLLIFFMCATRWKIAEANLPTNLPKGVSVSEEQLADMPDIEYIIIKMTPDEDRVSVILNERECAGLADLQNRLFELRKKVNVPVVIDADRDISFQNVITVLNSAIKANFQDVSFATPVLSR